VAILLHPQAKRYSCIRGNTSARRRQKDIRAFSAKAFVQIRGREWGLVLISL